ncbi:protein FAM161B-like isoform X2 [Bacillus rossius redtenbacheri]|uniref:protein FAM161B-like isoform X2 n=1 Tax=Bacillus rossius redtenbacheri TaxID=93214 RepID=UPI002FDD72EA
MDSFLDFYSSIPDYMDVNHLSDREFNTKMEYLREKQQWYLNATDSKSFVGVTTTIPSNKTKLCGNRKRLPKSPANARLNESVPSYTTSKENVSSHKNLDLKKEQFSLYSHDMDKSATLQSGMYSEEHERDVHTQSVLSDTLSVPSGSNDCKKRAVPAINLNNCVAGEDGSLVRGRAKVRASNGTNKVRDIHRLLDDVWDGFSEVRGRRGLSSGSDFESDDRLASTKSLPSSPGCRPSKSVAWKESGITVPQPFHMTLRDEEERCANYLLSLEAPPTRKQPTEQFRANPVPESSRVLLYDELMAREEESFVKREDSCQLRRLCHSSPDLRHLKPFKARPVPHHLFSSYVAQRMREDEFYRDLKRRVRAEELLKASSLPPAMAARERLARDRSTPSGLSSPPRCQRGRKTPDYEHAHRVLAARLQDRYDDNITTSPLPFRLETARRAASMAARFSPDSSSSSPYEPRTPVGRRLRPQSVLGLPLNRNNLAAVLRIQSARQRLEQELARQQEELLVRERARARSRLMRRNPVWQALAPSAQQDLAMRIHTRRQEEHLRREEHQQFMERMMQRVRRSPTLFERQGLKQQRATAAPDTPETCASRSSQSTERAARGGDDKQEPGSLTCSTGDEQ